MKTNSTKPNKHGEDQLICYCFGYTKRDLEEDFRNNGSSSIMERIMAEKRFGGCQCASKNPSGR
ncbi:MAG: hypothetical protein QG577_1305 [Thermodesulfobacteriota bacterium]|nr:hypothetical protein [Thermodesulfobacteriota bacterium]